ncbi:molybdopterin molybdotransferase MoeA [Campylobacter fetus]|uniref:Molybdopterin molybdenumtransferase n=1 Tax=Campylobacter fetus subsp. testudinum TaxID=1507806 RepID=A0AAX0HBP0_CAMFE|nr:molybdopterin molybdotransferase MoeA [Campylobacter fetus]ALV64908.1 molybdopterin molybdenumtransferase [Campylobacter fetus subsp. testudinum Sp3]EAK0829808.1 molybdopterin molybdotransferase MoeA [Campylobacter fetus]OCR86066.1 molybdenum cofactor biosynthesis protein MoaA [Campylobacter fetus subsp. testudinum]OCR89858.1 molybdenum cofactor biosynthesis protein MoaA [Campylobacter fetus subsp. testudinum]OCR90987.1 molybdenum cofactor biosynthesis protein MoaA [Campylobacter fetus subs
MDVKSVFETISNLKPVENYEFISLDTAFGRVLANDVIAIKPLPAFDNSALDGYAFNYNDRKNPLLVKGTIFAGDKKEYHIKKNECYKIMTGAIFPTGSDTVMMIEDESFDENGYLIITDNIKKDNARKMTGEEVKIGDILLRKNELLTPANIMLLAAQGISYVKVFSNLKIAIFSSGDEINEPWQNSDERSIYNANAFGVLAMLKQNGFNAEYKGILKDEKNILKEQIKNAKNYDVLITSGGASKGEADFMQSVLLELGFKEIFSSIDVRPAKPTKLYQNDSQTVFILPGNPMACFMGCFLSVIPAIKKLCGFNEFLHKTYKAKFKGNLKLKPTRANIVIGRYENGEFMATNENKFSPAMIMPISISNAIYISSIAKGEISDQEIVEIYKLS